MTLQSPSASDWQRLSSAAQHFSAGNLDRAHQLAQQLCRSYPDFGQAYKLLGSTLQLQGKPHEAVQVLRHAVRLLPDDAQALSNLGNALASAGHVDEALAAHRRAVVLSPDAATLRYNLGCLLLARNLRDEALEQFCLAYQRTPQDADLARLCRELLIEQTDFDLKVSFCRFNLANIPDDAGAMGMLGALLVDGSSGDQSEAEQLLRDAVRLSPGDAASRTNLCVLLKNQSRLAEAIEVGQQAAELAPMSALIHNNLGTALRDAGAWEQAKAKFLRALACDSEYVDAWYNLGCVSADLEQHEEARAAYIEAVTRTPRAAWLLQGAHACRQLADWDVAELMEAELARQLENAEGSTRDGNDPSPFAYLATPGTDATGQLRVARRFAAQFGGRPALWSGVKSYRGHPLRIGLLSADFRDHATAHLLTGVLEALDRSRYQLFAYDYGPARVEDVYRKRLEAVIHQWVHVGAMSDLEAAQRMLRDGLDIAIDLKGWTQGFRAGILAYRPAPIQMQWLGYPGSMGAPWIDYIIADSTLIPHGTEAGYSEKIVRLPGTYQPNDRNRIVGRAPSRAELGLPDAAFVMVAFHQPYKITRDTFLLWMRLLQRIPDSVLWLLEVPAMARKQMIDVATSSGVTPSRLIWAPRVSATQNLGRLSVADLALDTFPVNAHTTASDALWVGVPLVARCGDTFVSRVSASIVTAAGLPELVVHSDAEWEEAVCRLSQDIQSLNAIKAHLARARNQFALFDTASFSKNLGIVLDTVLRRHVSSSGPDHLDVLL